jgi:hypothetical protein
MPRENRDLKELEWLAFLAQKHGLDGLVSDIKKAVSTLKSRNDMPSTEDESNEDAKPTRPVAD